MLIYIYNLLLVRHDFFDIDPGFGASTNDIVCRKYSMYLGAIRRSFVIYTDDLPLMIPRSSVLK
jgi:hypothetical protein